MEADLGTFHGTVQNKYQQAGAVMQAAVAESVAACTQAQMSMSVPSMTASQSMPSCTSDWQTVATPDGKTYYWNTRTRKTTWDPPWPLESARTLPGSVSDAVLSQAAAPGASYNGGGGGVEGTSWSGAKRDMASLVFKKYNLSHSGVLSDDEVAELCMDMDHPVEPDRLALGMQLLDVNGDGRLTRDECSMWWREGERRWEVFQMDDEQYERVRGLATFFHAFGPENGYLPEVNLHRLHLTLKGHGHTSKSLHKFMTDADPEGDGRLTLYKLHKWWFREGDDRPAPAKPTFPELRRPVDEHESREDYLVEEAARVRDKNAMLERAGRKIAYADESHTTETLL